MTLPFRYGRPFLSLLILRPSFLSVVLTSTRSLSKNCSLIREYGQTQEKWARLRERQSPWTMI